MSHRPTKRSECLKIGWMLSWRIIFITSLHVSVPKIFLVSIIIAAIIVYGFGYTFRIFPLFNLLRLRSPFIKLPPKWKSNYGSSYRGAPDFYRSRPGPTAPARDTRTYIDKATQKGKTSQYQPYLLDKIKLQRSPWMVGSPGFGLNKSGFSQENIAAGQAGEINFAKTLQKTGLINNFQSFWSAAMPDRDFFGVSTKYDTDIDCILFDGRTIYLIDLKNYRGGDVTYTLEGDTMVCIDNPTKDYVRLRSTKRSRNMNMAKEFMEKHTRGRGYEVQAVVVLMAQNFGGPEVKNLYWPDYIPAYSLDDFLLKLQKTKGFDTSKDHTWISGKLAALVKKS